MSESNGVGYCEVIPAKVYPWAGNPRQRFDEAKLAELATSIAAKGILEPILVRPWPKDDQSWRNGSEHPKAPEYQIAAGERRWRAACLAELRKIPVIVRKLNDRDMLEIAVVENEQREDVSPLEKALGYVRLVEEHQVDVAELALRVGKSASTIRGLMLLTRLPELARKAVEDGLLPVQTAQLIARIGDETAREHATVWVLINEPALPGRTAPGASDMEALQEALKGGYPVMAYRDAKDMIAVRFQRELKGAPFSRKALDLVPDAGSCDDCPKRVGNLQREDPEAWSGLRADVCTSPECYHRKALAHRDRQLNKALSKGIEAMDDAQAARVFNAQGELTFIQSSSRGWELAPWIDLDATWDNGKPNPPTYREVIGDQVLRHTLAAVDPRGKLRYLCPTKRVEQALQSAGLIPGLGAKAGNGKPKDAGPSPGSREHLDNLADRMGRPREEFASDDVPDGAPEASPAPSGPKLVDVYPRAEAMALAEIAKTAEANFEDLDALGVNGGPDTNAAYQALQLIAWDVALDEATDTFAADAARSPLSRRCPGIFEGDRTDERKRIAAWVQKASPRELLAYLLEVTACRVMTNDSDDPILDAILSNFTDAGDMGLFEEKAQAELRRAAGGDPLDGIDEGLRRALHSFEGAEERWAKRMQKGLSDTELKEAIGEEFVNGGHASNGCHYSTKGGKNPAFWYDHDQQTSSFGKPTLGGKALLDRVRKLLGIPAGASKAGAR